MDEGGLKGWMRVGEGWMRVGEGWMRVGEGWMRVSEGWLRGWVKGVDERWVKGGG